MICALRTNSTGFTIAIGVHCIKDLQPRKQTPTLNPELPKPHCAPKFKSQVCIKKRARTDKGEVCSRLPPLGWVLGTVKEQVLGTVHMGGSLVQLTNAKPDAPSSEVVMCTTSDCFKRCRKLPLTPATKSVHRAAGIWTKPSANLERRALRTEASLLPPDVSGRWPLSCFTKSWTLNPT